MVTRKLAQVSTSDDEGAPRPSPSPSSSSSDSPVPSRHRTRRRGRRQSPPRPKRRKKLLRLTDDDDEEDEELERKDKEEEMMEDDEEEMEEEEEEEEEEEQVQEDAKPIGEVVRVSGKGRGQRRHYKEFEFDGNRFELEDPVLLTPEDKKQKPYVAIIKDISQTRDGSMMVTGQWFYRPEEAEKKGGGSWLARDTRELFYSFHRDEVPAESVMHKCVVHFVPLHKQLPSRKQFPGFIVQKVYDTVEKKLWKLTDKDYEDGKQEEIDVLVQKTISRLGELLDVDTDGPIQLEEQTRNKRLLRKRHVSPLEVPREDDGTPRLDQTPRGETPVSCIDKASKYYIILAEAKVLTKEMYRDKCLEKLLQAVEYVCNPNSTDSGQGENRAVDADIQHSNGDGKLQEEGGKGHNSLTWPDTAISAVVSLEKATHEAVCSDLPKYNQKMRSLVFNLKQTELLARRLLNGELEPSKIVSMSANELKEGLTEEEIARNQPEEKESMQMTDARCKRCNEKTVGVKDIIQAGHGDRYQLECSGCGNSWYAPRDEVSMLTIDGPSSVTNVGTAPWATAKFENIEKKKSFDGPGPVLETQKSFSENPGPVLETQKSFNKSRPDDPITPRNPGPVSETQKPFNKPRSDDPTTPKNPNPNPNPNPGSVLETQKSFNKSRGDDTTTAKSPE